MNKQNKFRKLKKAQMEIMGLTIVIILIIVGVVFAMRFVVFKESPNIKSEFTKTQMVSNFGMSLLQTTTRDCKGTDVTELLTDCAEFETIVCEDGKQSCDYVAEEIADILNSTMVQWKVPYHISLNLGSEDIGIEPFTNGGCDDNSPGQSKLFFLPTDRGTLTIKMFICDVFRQV